MSSYIGKIKPKNPSAIKYTVLILVLYFIHFLVELASDDFWFSEVSSQYGLIEYIISRYEGWTGRVFPEFLLYTMLNELVWLWRIINPIIIILLSYGLVRILKRKVEFKDVLLALLTLGFFSPSILSNGFFWITGTFNYSWPIAFGLISMIPYADIILRNETPNVRMYPFYFLFGILASISQEQVALCISSFSILALGSLIYNKIKIDKKMLLLTGTIIVGTFILILAPGNGVRWQIEVDHWYPQFDEMSVLAKIFLGMIWLFEKLFIEMKALVFLLSIITIISCIKKETINQSWYFKFFVLLVLSITGVNLLGIGQNYVYDFQSIANIVINKTGTIQDMIKSVLPYLFWIIWALLLLIVSIKNTNHKFFVLFSYLAAISTLVIIFFSPTIYASGNRVLTVCSVILALIVLNLITKENIIPNNRFALYIYAVIPFLNIIRILHIWVVQGFQLL
ncbi:MULTISPECIES: DUF6056 family protein [Bacillaceae]|uniref:DUF6056 family protein n=1 Tax=Bacillaceae TaxID=186817 RepID=UPI0022E2DF0D|nr:DUF6056 family protein [Caldibacillus thermoamylovorans]